VLSVLQQDAERIPQVDEDGFDILCHAVLIKGQEEIKQAF
jgi:hypothetical protein